MASGYINQSVYFVVIHMDSRTEILGGPHTAHSDSFARELVVGCADSLKPEVGSIADDDSTSLCFFDTESNLPSGIQANEYDCLIVDNENSIDIVSLISEVRSVSNIPILIWASDNNIDTYIDVAGFNDCTVIPNISGVDSDRGLVNWVARVRSEYGLNNVVRAKSNLFEGTTAGFGIVDSSFEFVYVDDPLTEYLGYADSSNFVGNSLGMMFTFDEFEDVRTLFSECSSERVNHLDDINLRHISGEVMTVDIQLLQLENGLVAFAISDDLGDTPTVSSSVELFDELYSHSSDGVFLINKDTYKIASASSGAFELIGLDDDRLVGTDFVYLLSEIDHETFDSIVKGSEEGFVCEEALLLPGVKGTDPIECYIELRYDGFLDESWIVLVVRELSSWDYASDLQKDISRLDEMVNAAPDPIILVEADTADVVETNTACCELVGLEREDILERNLADFVPDDEVEKHLEVFKEHVAQGGGSHTRFSDGSYITVQKADGETIEGRYSNTVVSVDGRELAQMVFQPLTDQVKYEHTLEALYELSDGLIDQDSIEAITEFAIEKVLKVDQFKGVGVYLKNGSLLEPVSFSDSVTTEFENLPTYDVGESYYWEAISSREKVVLDSNSSEGPGLFDREIVFPLLGDSFSAALFVGESQIEQSTPFSMEVAEIFASIIESNFDRVKNIANIRQSRTELGNKKRKLEDISDLNDRFRSLNNAFIEADSNQDIKDRVCAELVEFDAFDGVLIGNFVPSDGQLDIEASSGLSRSFLNDLPLSLAEDKDLTPSLQAVDNGDVCRLDLSPETDGWGYIAYNHGYAFVVSMPLIYEQISHGVLTIYSTQKGVFDDSLMDVLSELTSVIAYHLYEVSVRNSHALDDSSHLRFSSSDLDGPIASLSSIIGADIHIQSVATTNAGANAAICYIPSVASAEISDAVDQCVFFSEVGHVGGESSSIYQLKLEREFLYTELRNLGVTVKSCVVMPDSIEYIVSIPTDRDQQKFVDKVQSKYPDVDLVATQDSIDEADMPWEKILSDSLTNIQMETLQTAYNMGYYDNPSKANGKEIAELLDISQSAFSNRVRAGLSNLLGEVWDRENE